MGPTKLVRTPGGPLLRVHTSPSPELRTAKDAEDTGRSRFAYFQSKSVVKGGGQYRSHRTESSIQERHRQP